MDTVTCEICGLDAPEHTMRDTWGGHVCDGNPECRPPMGPRQREVATLTTAMLDDLEDAADVARDRLDDSSVGPAVLRALIDAARPKLEADSRRLRVATATVGYDEDGPDDVPIAAWAAGRGSRAIALAYGAGPGTTPLSEPDVSREAATLVERELREDGVRVAAVDAARKR